MTDPATPAQPRTAAGRALLADFTFVITEDQVRAAILAIEAEAAPAGGLRDALRHYDERIDPERSTGEMSAREWRDSYFALARIALKELEDCRAEAAPAGGLREALRALVEAWDDDHWGYSHVGKAIEQARAALAASPSAGVLDVERQPWLGPEYAAKVQP